VVLITTGIAFSWPQPPPFALTGHVKSGFPPVQFPPFDLPLKGKASNASEVEDWTDWSTYNYLTNTTTLDVWDSFKEVGPGCVSIAAISILQNVVIAKAFGSGQPINGNQEMIALGVSHILGSFFSAIPTSGSFTRSAVNDASGVRTPISGIFTGNLPIKIIVRNDFYKTFVLTQAYL